MQKQRIFVGVVGFSDVERHALNTVFRLSEERELSYAPWAPGAGTLEATASSAAPQVMLVDGTSAEAVLFHARQPPRGQWLIWVGSDAPEHAWRVLERPIHWAGVLHDLDAVFAAHQVDSGHLDLDVTSPSLLGDDVSDLDQFRRCLVVGLTVQENALLRIRLAMVGVNEVDVADSTEAAVDLMGRNSYRCGVFNLDDLHIDAWTLMALFRKRNLDALPVAISEVAGPLSGWWSRRRIRRDAERLGIVALLSRPIQIEDLSAWMDRL